MFKATTKLTLIVSKPVTAETIEQALEKAKKLTASDFVKFKPAVDYIDGEDKLLEVGIDEWLD